MRDPVPHLTEEEIEKINRWDFSGGFYSRASLHLEKCSTCRERIDSPTAEDVKRVFKISAHDTIHLPQKTFSSFIGSKLATPLIAFSILIICLFSMYLVINNWLERGDAVNNAARNISSQGNEIAALTDRDHEKALENLNLDSRTNALTSNPAGKTEESNRNSSPVNAKIKSGRVELVQRFPNENQREQSRSAQKEKKVAEKLSYSETRSLSESNPLLNTKLFCPNITTELPNTETKVDETLTFSWKPIPQAVKYHLYLSDMDQNLIDEYETAGETYKSKTLLKQNAIYQWKVIATLKSGKTLNLEPIRFSIGKTSKNQRMILSKQIESLRCVPN